MSRYYMFNKPKGCVTAKRDSLSKTVMDYFPEDIREELHPAGRLDKDTEGFLLITDDGSLTFHLMRPEHHIAKTYFFYAIGELTEERIRNTPFMERGHHRNNGISPRQQERTAAQIPRSESLFGGNYH